MNNFGNIQKLHYCDKKSGNTSKCAEIATRQITMKRKDEVDVLTAKQEHGYRCEDHALTGTVNKKVVESLPFDQSFALTKIVKYLQSLIGENIVSKMHTAKQLRVKYVKPNTGGVMCFQEHSKKWKFVYYEQITKVLSPDQIKAI